MIVSAIVKLFSLGNKLIILSDVLYEILIKHSKEDFINPVNAKTGAGILVVKIDDADEMLKVLAKVNKIKTIQAVVKALQQATGDSEFDPVGTEMELDPEFEARLNKKKKEDLN